MLCNLDAIIANHRKDNPIIIHDLALETIEEVGTGGELDRFWEPNLIETLHLQLAKARFPMMLCNIL